MYLNQPIPASTIVHKFEEAIAFVEEVGFPVVIVLPIPWVVPRRLCR